MTYEDIQKANELITPIEFERKNKQTGKTEKKLYAEVHQRIKAYRSIHPCGTISTEIVNQTDNSIMIKAYIWDAENKLLGTGHASETSADGNFINKTSMAENCETSAVGRALGMCGFGIDGAIASVEEIKNQDEAKEEASKIDVEQIGKLKDLLITTDTDIEEFNKHYEIETLQDLSKRKYTNAVAILEQKKKKKEGGDNE